MVFEALQQNWFDLLQSVFIVGGFLIAAFSFRSEQRSRKIHHLLTLQQNRRNIWEPFLTDPTLTRILHKEVDLKNYPITFKECQLVKQSISHLYAVYEAMKQKQISKPDGIEGDIKQYFSLPIPNRIWDEVREFQNEDFAEYVEELVDEDVKVKSASVYASNKNKNQSN